MNANSWLSINRRRLLGRALLGGSSFLGSVGLTSAATNTKRKANILLDRIPSIPAGLRSAVEFPLIEALHGRRSRRFGLGFSLPDGPLKYESGHQPAPLNELEQMLVLTATAGNTGWQFLIPHNPAYSPNIPNYASSASGRTFPSAAGFHTTEFFFTDDQGTYFLPTRDASLQQNGGGNQAVDLNEYLQAHRDRIQRLSNQRLHLPADPRHMEMHNAWCANRPGSTLIIPVADAAQHQLANLCYLVQNRLCIYDDISDRAVPNMDRFRSLVDVDNPLPLSFVEQMTLSELSVEVSTACYAGHLMLQALGLGGWMFTGLNPVSVLGASGDPEVPGLGFHHTTDKRWPLPNVTGLPDVFEGYCPPHFKNMEAAVGALVERKFGHDGPFNRGTAGPYRANPTVRSAGEPHNDQFQDCVATMAQYIFDEFGRFPGTISSMFVLTYLQAHHLDLDYYDKHHAAGAYLETHARHSADWHDTE